MALLTKEQIKELIKERKIKTVDDIESTLKEMFADTIQTMRILNWGQIPD